MGLPVLVNIHDVALAEAYSDRIIGIAKGLIAFDGRPSELTPEVLRRVYRRDPRTLVGVEHALPQRALATGGAFGDVAN